MTTLVHRLISTKKIIACIGLLFSLCLAPVCAENGDRGQIIQINTRFHSFLGKPSWLLVIRDLDHGENIPYLYDIERGENTWFALTYGKNYLIIASTLQISTYGSRLNRFKKYTIHDFCHLESQGRIIRGQSLYLTIDGDLTQHEDTVNCEISRYTDAFGINRNTID
jgi:hypothetical protein